MNNNKILLEVCADSVESALIAQKGGANRIEFCDNLVEGGTTPSYGQIKLLRELLDIKLYVLIRPRGGDFLYSDIEFKVMKSDIEFCGEMNCDGVVIGMLNADGSVDMERCRELAGIAEKYSMGITFHRAFDRSNDLFISMNDAIELGCERILTSGGKNSALEGADIISELIKKAEDRIVIMPGAGVTPENAEELIKRTGLKELHGTFRNRVMGNMVYRNNELGSTEEEYSYCRTDINKVEKVIKIINN